MLRVEHDCEINIKQEEIFFLPNLERCQKLRMMLRQIFMASEKSPSARRYLRTHSAIIYEKRRHLRNFTNIIHPFSLFRHWWNLVMILTMIGMMLLVPYEAAFDMTRVNSWEWTIAKNFLLFLFCADIVVNFMTGSLWYTRKCRYFDITLRRVEMDYKMIMRRYVQRGTFILDLLGSFPTDLLFLDSWNIHVVARELSTMIYVFRLFSAHSYITMMLDTYDLAHSPYGLFYTIPWLLIVLHWLACITWIVPIVTVTLGVPERPRNASWTNIDDLWSSDRQIRYWLCLCRSVAILTRSGFLHPEPNTMEDQYLAIVIQLLGTLFFCIIVTQLMQYFKGSNSSKLQYRATVAQLKQYMRHKQLPKTVQRRFITYYEFRYQNRYFRETEILGTISSQMRQEIGMNSCRKLVENVPFFNNLPNSLLTRIVALLRLEIFLTNDVIVQANQTGDCMYFIATGTVAIYTNSGKEVCHLEDGAHFGEIALVMPDERRVASVVAVEVCELYRLERADFARTIHPYPILWERIKRIAIERHEKTAIINAQ